MPTAGYSLKDGKSLIEFSHKVIENYVKDDMVLEITEAPPKFREKRGVFITLKVNGALRGCIGHPLPVMPLIEAVRDLSISSATEDFRFEPISKKELDALRVEVSILTVPSALKLKERRDTPNMVKVGRDGLIIALGRSRGLLLPQVAVEEGWDSEQFLQKTCWKAGLPEDSWLNPKTDILTFQSLIFTEAENRKVTMTEPQ